MKTYSRKNTQVLHAVIAFMLVIVLSMITGMTNVNAANECKGISGTCAGQESFVVDTSSGWFDNQAVKLTQTKGDYTYETMMLSGASKYTYKKHYGIYYVTVTDSLGNTVLDNCVWSSKSMSIKLDKNTSYTITVTPETDGNVYSRAYTHGFKVGKGWTSLSTWKVSKTRKVSNCAYEYE